MRRRRSRGALLGGLAAFALLQGGLALTLAARPMWRDPAYTGKFERLYRLPADPAGLVVAFGSSRVGMGLDAGRCSARLRERLGFGTAFNFGLSATGPATNALYLKRVLDAGVRPRLVLFEILPSMLDQRDLPGLPREAAFFQARRLWSSEREWALSRGLIDALPRDTLPGYDLRFQLLGRIDVSALPVPWRPHYATAADAHGFHAASTARPEPRETALARARSEYAARLAVLVPSPPALAAIADAAEACRAAGAEFRLLLMPEGPEFRTMYPPRSWAAVERVLGDLRARGVETVSAREWFAEEAFSDSHHLTRNGAARFAGRLADEVLVPLLAGPRPTY